ncbi:MAG: TrkH family potassium uptake protein, partial [Rubricella sp.]
MIALRPIGYVIGLMVMTLGAAMLIPMLADILDPRGDWRTFAASAFFTVLAGAVLTLTCASSRTGSLDLRQTFILTTSVWLALPFFGAVPFVIGELEASATDAFFEAMSGLTTTGSTVFTGLDDLSWGTNLWRGMLQWFGGIGIIVVAMVFLPTLRVGGMQVFRSEGFDTFGKILPRAAEIAKSISAIYVGLTGACFLAYSWAGMPYLDAVVHAMTTIATGGFSSHDASFGVFGPATEYVAVCFMLIASLPFVRYVQLVAGTARPLVHDSQVRTFFGIVLAVVLTLTAWLILQRGWGGEEAFRKALFNGTSILTGTGYASADYGLWGTFPVTLMFMIGLVGGCAGSTCCSIKVFRFQLLWAAVVTQIRQISSPRGVFTLRFSGGGSGLVATTRSAPSQSTSRAGTLSATAPST